MTNILINKEFLTIINELSSDTKFYALLKYYLMRIKHDDLWKFQK